MKLQVDIPDKLNKKLKLYKIKNDFETLQEALLNILDRFEERKK